MNDIDLIIEHLTNELDALKHELDKCVNGNDPDYEGAQVFQKAIQSKSAEIRVLINRRDSNTKEINLYLMKARLQNGTIKKQEERLSNYSGNPNRLPSIKETLKFYKQELNEINNKIIELNLTNRSQHFDEDVLLTQIEYVITSMLQTDREIRNKLLRAKLTQLGFQLNTHQNWILSLKKDQTNPVQIHQILSILCFEIINLNGKNKGRLVMA